MKNKILLEYVAIVVFVVSLWGFTHIFTLGWGLPNPISFAIDSIPPQRDMSAFDMMHHENMQYPPLQYLIVSFLVEKKDEPRELTDELVALRSDKIFSMNLITATMSLITALAISFFTRYFLSSTVSSILAAFLFISNPLSLYYSHTSNMDQPYLMWWALSIITLFVADKRSENGSERSFLVWNFLVGTLFSLSFSTKDQVYALYAIPLVTYLIWLSVRKRSLKFPLIALFAWILSFGATTSLVYWAIGGWDVFYTHVRWISNSEHQILYAQCKDGFLGRLNFILKCLLDLAKCIESPLIVFCAVSALILLFYGGKNAHEIQFKAIWILIFLLLSLVSLQLLFVHVTRFSFPRYYLPILPIASCLASSCFIALRHKNHLLAYALLSIMIVYQTALAWQFLHSINNDSRILMKNYVRQISFINSLKNPKIALTGVTKFRKVAFGFDSASNTVFRKMTLVNEPLPTFGFLSEWQKSIEQKYSSLLLFDPEIVINAGEPNKTWTDILSVSGYKMVGKILKQNLILPALFQHESPQFEIFIKNSHTNTNDALLFSEYSSRSFEENLMAMANVIDVKQINRQIHIIGKYFPSFTVPDMANNHIKPVTLDFLADAYELAGRLDESAKTRLFILKTVREENLRIRSLSFFKKHSNYLHLIPNDIE